MIWARRAFGLAVAAVCALLLWRSLEALLFQYRVTGTLDGAAADPAYALSVAGAGLGVAGGAMAMARLPAGGALAVLGGVIYSLFGWGALAYGADESLWLERLVFSALIVVLGAALLRMRRD